MHGKSVGFIGLGNMGEGMAYNLATKGFAPLVFDTRQEPLDRLKAEGAAIATSCAEIGERCDIVCIAVFDDSQIEQVVFGSDENAGILAGMDAGGLIILHPTAPPATVRKVAEAGAAKGVDVLDAPMTGGANVAARAGTLTFMVGGDDAVVARARPVLEAMATSVFHVGPLGSGAAAKIINNYLGVSQTILMREALRLADNAGIGEERILEILNTGGVGSSWQSINWGRIKTQEATYTTGRAGMVAMASKDMRLAHRMAREGGVPTPTLDAMIAASLPDLDRSGLTDNGVD
ncbi:NAD-binding protein [Sphingomonas histidinilytica]|jgi:3-hydroxyisobutyrate dehydrogenase|uniref:3-hydroxyisobutyrate dehydrogenase n=3 Tax=Rhizorhabdus histidinilytica TaxID=439228 RepID=A0A1T5ES54_9SPHN|nr:NAD-binding protein [Rhizorhabdus histidinilytica]SKB86734.1 3-hydroxyisobutyrate dehydrogenase [Rhizorhabdus histidinilytica]